MERATEWPKKHIKDYQTTTPSIWHDARPLLNALTARISDGKISYWFDWHVENTPDNIQGGLWAGDSTAPRVKSKLGELGMHLGMWKNACIIEPENYDGKPWQFGFLIPDSNQKKMSVCSLILEGRVKILKGPGILAPVGMSLDHQELPIKFIDMCRRNEYPKIPLI